MFRLSLFHNELNEFNDVVLRNRMFDIQKPSHKHLLKKQIRSLQVEGRDLNFQVWSLKVAIRNSKFEVRN